MAEQKTKPSDASVEAFINSVEDEVKRKDSFTILDVMKQATQMEPKLWGGSMIGFGSYHYKYASGHEGDSFLVGFSPRKGNLALYGLNNFDGAEELRQKLGKHKMGKGCLYINRLSDVDLSTLREMVNKSLENARKTNAGGA